ncbi:wall-associated receptor kinase-like 8 [Populus nigra]|uniref:wall-associated receptor kinase-like 8 n=1 Tax=Populus nigra TaxID=3691 RepID=UPI002B266D4A|nr:wall-associated receptor kinase-like 8 [Populus nigra]
MILQRWVFLLMIVAAVTGATANPDVRDGCQERCGDVIVPYPFGIGERRCAMNENFFLNCTSTDDGHHELWLGENMPARNISLLNGTITVGIFTSFDCYEKSGRQSQLFNRSISLGPAYTFSDSRNMFTAVGCDTISVVTNKEETSGVGCLSLCTVNANMSKNNPCSGSGCCQTSIPKGLKSLNITIGSNDNHMYVSEFNPCGFAFLEDKDSLDLSDWQLSRTPKHNDTSNVVIEWVAQTETCEEARANKSSYACGINTNCNYSDNGQGYRCACKKGFEGSPYLEKGCQDIDECKDPKKYTCHGKCHNTIGDYECKCPLGMGGDGKVGCRGFGIITIIISVVVGVVGVLLLLIGGWWLYRIMEKRKSNELKQKFFRQNGGLLLQQQLSSGDQGGISKTKLFSSEELETATDSFNVNRILGQGGQGTVYKGMLPDGVIVAVKRSTVVGEENLEGFINEVCILSQINQRNIVRLLGCCLEAEVPLLVYEFIPNGTLSEYLHRQNEEFPLSWEMRLQIAAETAGALCYLHSAASIPIYHRDVKSTNILLDHKYRAKIADFGTSRSLSVDQTHLTTNVQGTFGYLDPEYFWSSQYTDKSDVYSFGVVLAELLTRQKAILTYQSQERKNLAAHFVLLMEENRIFDIVDAQIKEHCPKEDVIGVANIAMRCLNLNGKKRPTMKQVTSELERIIQLSQKKDVQQNNEEADQSITAEVISAWDDASTSITCSSFQVDQALSSSDVEPLVPFKTW